MKQAAGGTFVLYELCEKLFIHEYHGGTIVNSDNFGQEVWLVDPEDETPLCIVRSLGHPDIDDYLPLYKEAPEGFFFRYTVYNVANPASPHKLATGYDPEAIDKIAPNKKQVSTFVLEQVRRSLPFPAKTHPFWGLRRHGELTELVYFRWDDGRVTPTVHHLLRKGSSSLLQTAPPGGRLTMSRFWEMVKKRLLRDVTDVLAPRRKQWSQRLNVLVVDGWIFAPPEVLAKNPLLTLAHLGELEELE